MKLLNIDGKLFQEREKDIASYQEKISKAHSHLHGNSLISLDPDFSMTGWVDNDNTCNESFLNKIIYYANKVQKNTTALVVLGIGGSFLGTKACIDTLKDSCNKSVKIFYGGWNLSASYHKSLLEKLENEEISLCVVSKSGKTMETTIAFQLLKEFMAKKYPKGFSHRIYVVTDKNRGALKDEADKNNYTMFPLDDNIGGRYSVLTAVGLFPMAVAGLDIKKIMSGAKKAKIDFSTEDLSENKCYQYAVLRNILYNEGKYIELFSTMEPHMQGFSQWLKQLFGESEGKDKQGILPVCVNYSADLHSVGQFFQEGNPLFFESLITAKNSDVDLDITFQGKTYRELNEIVYHAVANVREENGTPVFRFEMNALDELSLGYIIYFFEKACAMCCLIQGINPFNQPGVEIYKSETIQMLKEK
ncbi:MAG: glucose-6-phosphate isomerase [Clostridiales bacterium]